MMREILLLGLLGAPLLVCAQGGPPMATDDPGTPGDGHWEINLGAIGTRTHDAWMVDLPDADINYGLGEHIQLNLDLPWTYTNANGRWRSGIGDTSIAVKWRFLDADETHGIELSMYPRYQTSLSNYSERIGVASPDKEFFLPFEAGVKIAGFDVAADLGRHFVEHDNSYWSAGIAAGHDCINANAECLAEVHREWGGDSGRTLLNLGMRWKITKGFTFLGALGREFGGAVEDRARALIYLGAQISL